MRTVTRFAVVLAVLAIAVSATLRAQDSVFRTAARMVPVYVTVSDASGGLVPDLTRDDFEVYDNGKLQPIALFESGVQPITVVLMLDRSGSMISNFKLVRSAAEQFVSQLLPGDKARIGSFSNRIQLDPREFTGSQRDLIAILRTELQEPGATPLWNAVNVGITALQHQSGRRVILVFTDGVDRPMNSQSISVAEVMRNAEAHDVMVFAVGLAGRRYFPSQGRRGGPGGRGAGIGSRGGLGQPPEFEKPDSGLPRVALATGGGYFELTSANNLSATFTRVADELHRQYALAFTPQTLDGRTHKLEVKVRRPGLKARARKSYLARKDVL
ncbi:MAG: VWA domain-containing protein [Acidobacteriota bacterium]|nr:VWA domain-containing protein [Acidobacteriota bacterium]